MNTDKQVIHDTANAVLATLRQNLATDCDIEIPLEIMFKVTASLLANAIDTKDIEDNQELVTMRTDNIKLTLTYIKR